MNISLTDVAIPADELTLAGHLRLPTETPSPGPAIVLTGPLTGVKEQVVGHYAARLAERGFATLEQLPQQVLIDRLCEES